MSGLSDAELQELYTWVDKVPLSRPKRNIARDFSDGGKDGLGPGSPFSALLGRQLRSPPSLTSLAVLFAEIINHYLPKIVEIHNYSAANSLKQKVYNWETLQRRSRPWFACCCSLVRSLTCSPLAASPGAEKTLRKLKYPLTPEEVQAVAGCKPMQIEKLLLRLKSKIAAYSASEPRPSSPSSNPGNPASSRRAAPQPSHGSDAQWREREPSREEDSSRLRSLHHGLGIPHAVDDRDQTIVELRDTISILELKISKLEQLLVLKDNKIAALTAAARH
jgi:hypothetical protein